MLKDKNIFRFLICVFGFSFLVFGFANAAILYLEPAEGQYYQGDTFIVNARIDTEDECINAIEANLSFSQDILEGVDFSKGNSILTIWLKSPTLEQESGLISFSAGIPGGYCGPIPGDPGRSDLLGKIIFQVHETPQIGTQINTKLEFLDSSQVLLNDGFGTPAKLTLKGAAFTILSGIPEIPKREWQEELTKDTIPPESFEIEIHQDPSIFEGKYFIIFQTQDKQTGIDYYEIAEQRRIIRGITRKIEWKKAESPYLLEDQSLRSIIKVKVVDKAGNERIAEYRPPYKITWRDVLPWIILVLIVWGIIWWLIRNIKYQIDKSKIK